ncbi:MAG: hypothetical protein QM767_03800 [Anaeromyxobacter sp.]
MAFRPAHYHTAYAARQQRVRVRGPRAPGALRGAGARPAGRAAAGGDAGGGRRPGAAGRGAVHLEADEMAYWLRDSPLDRAEVERVREATRFELVPAPQGTPPAAAPGVARAVTRASAPAAPPARARAGRLHSASSSSSCAFSRSASLCW